MPAPEFPPRKDADLLSWSTHFNTEINLAPATYGLDATQATAYTGLHVAYATAYSTAITPTTNSKANVNAKNQTREQLLNGLGGAWELVNIIQAFPGTTNIIRGDLGLRIPDTEPTPVPAPKTAPDLSIISTAGRVIKVRLRDQDSEDNRGKPDGVQGATVLYHVSEETPPNDPAVWTFAMNASKTAFDVEIPGTVAAGAKVWLTAFWFNARKDSSAASTFENTRISDQLPLAA